MGFFQPAQKENNNHVYIMLMSCHGVVKVLPLSVLY